MEMSIDMLSEYKGTCVHPVDDSIVLHQWGIELSNEDGKSFKCTYYSTSRQKPTLKAVIHQTMIVAASAECTINLTEQGRTDLLELLPFKFDANDKEDMRQLEEVRAVFGPFYWPFVNAFMADVMETMEQAEANNLH